MVKEVKELLKERVKKREIIKKYPTGISILDQLLGGGFPANSIVCLIAHSILNAEIFLYHFASRRKTYYLTTSKRPEDIKRIMKDLKLETSNINFIHGTSAYLIDSTLRKIQWGGDSNMNIIIDNFSFYLGSSDLEVMKRIIDIVRDVIITTNSIAFLYVYKGTHSKEIENLIFNLSDVVFDVDYYTVGNIQETTLSVPKIHGMKPIKRMKIIIGDKIEIDTSREIA
jgi:archaellum biogenesis ATPase FlaH